MRLRLFQIDAFTDTVFSGNPAAVCPLEEWLPEATMQAIAAENNLSETAFFVPGSDAYGLRWFTPACEIDLCGHATLATAHLLFNHLAEVSGTALVDTLSGRLTVEQDGDRLVMDFPAKAVSRATPDPDLITAVGKEPTEAWTCGDFVLVYDTESDVRAIDPDMNGVSRLAEHGVIVTAPGDECDFVSRYFAPSFGVPEDPVTGSAHCILTPYWAARTGKKELSARQISKRGGKLICTDRGNRVSLAGQAVMYMEGAINI
ncbi:MAG: PhzF family phenazine biosynthesis protein [Rhodospirillales bacterium]|nr:PhzF family phenazine biosynthesis protein [Rhodospirillales bacterium]